MAAHVTQIKSVVASGNEVVYTFTLRKPRTAAQIAAGEEGSIVGDITGATITANIQPSGSAANVISAHAVVVLVGASATCTLTLTEAESVLMTGGADPRATEDYIIDLTMVLATVTTTFGPAVQPVRSVVGAT